MSKSKDINRRDFFRGAAIGSLGLAMAVEEINAYALPGAQAADEKPGPPVNCAVIGLGPQGRDIMTSLAKMGNAPIVAICDTYDAAAFVKRAQDIAPKADFTKDYRQVLSNRNVKAVFVATPSHKHKQIVLDALQAGKHVYCEAPLAVDLAEARDIARAAMGASAFFQSGLQYRNNKMHTHVASFMKSGVLGRAVVGGRAQFHRRMTWRFPHGTPERDRELNWRLARATSNGLLGEIGIHQLDIASWYLGALPVSVVGFGGIIQYSDGRDVPDTVQVIVEYPKNIRFNYTATIVNSFDGAYEVFYGSDMAVYVRDQRGWMFKEAKSPVLGWEVYAKKDTMQIGDDATGTGIALVADATKLIALNKEPSKVGTDVSKTALYQSCMAFLDSIRANKKPACGPLEGYIATMISAKANEAALTGSKIVFQKDWFTL